MALAQVPHRSDETWTGWFSSTTTIAAGTGRCCAPAIQPRARPADRGSALDSAGVQRSVNVQIEAYYARLNAVRRHSNGSVP